MTPQVELGAGAPAAGDAPGDRAPVAPASPNAWESALQAWETVLELVPDHPVARVQRIECLVRLKRWDAVIAACTVEPALAIGDEIRFASRLSAGGAFDRALLLWERIATRAESDEQAVTAVRAQLRCFAKLGLRGRKPVIDQLAPWADSADAERRQANEHPRHIAILGVSYCGSTVLSLVLGALPGVANIGESHWLLEPRVGKSRESHNLTPDGFEQCVFCGPDCPVITDDLRRRLAAHPAAFHSILAQALGTDIVVSADKNYSHVVPRDPDLHHDAIVVFRDPLANWRSQARRSATLDADARLKYLGQWAIDYRNFLDNYPNTGRKIIVDFDQFLARPHATLERICQALKLPHAADALEYWRHRQHCVGGNINVRERLASGDLDGLRINPGTRPGDPTDHADGPLPAEVREVAQRLRAASLHASRADRRTGARPRIESGIRGLVAAGHGHLLRAASLAAPGSPRLAKRRSRLLWRRGDRLGALGLIEQALATAPGEERLRREFARIAERLAASPWARDHPEVALGLLDRVLTVVPDHPTLPTEYHRTVARIVRQRRAEGDTTGALDLLERAMGQPQASLELAADYASLAIGLARSRRGKGDAAGALALLERALARSPGAPHLTAEYATTAAGMAREQCREGDAAGALDGIEHAVARVGDHPQLTAARASLLHQQARYHDALEAWRRLAEQESVETTSWVGMAKALYAMEHREAIESLVDEYLRVLGDRTDRHVRAAYVALAGRRFARFEALCAHAEAQADRDNEGWPDLAALHLAGGRLGQAVNCLDRAPRLAAALAARRSEVVRALRLVGIDPEVLSPAERADLRMPDLALLTLLGRAPPAGKPAAAGRIVMVYTSLGPGGAERQLANTVRGLGAAARGHAVVLMPSRDKDGIIDRFRATELDALPITIEPCATGKIDQALVQTSLGTDATDLLALLPEPLRHEVGILATRFLHSRPAVVHGWSDYRSINAGVAATIAGVPRIVLGGRSIAPAGLPGYFRTVYQALLRQPGVALLNNSVAGALSYAAWLGVDARRIGVIHNGVDLGLLEGARDPQVIAAHRARLGLPPEARIVGTAFRLGGVKRPLLWVQAAAEVARRDPNVQFVIVGDGPLREDVRALAAQLGIADRLHMPGLIRDVVPWFELMDVVLLTSEREGTSNTALEAQALGIPVVSTAVGGMPETMIPGVSGLLVDPDPSPQAIADAVARALTDEAWRSRARPAAQAFIRERFSIERMIRDTLEIYGLGTTGGAEGSNPERSRYHAPQRADHAGRVPETVDQPHGQA